MSERLSDELISAYLDDELSPEERARVESWLAEDAQARLQCDELKTLRGTFTTLPRLTLGDGFRARVAAAIEQARKVETKEATNGAEKPADKKPVTKPAVATKAEVKKEEKKVERAAKSRDGEDKPEPADWRRWFWPLATVAAAIVAMCFWQGENPQPNLAHGDPENAPSDNGRHAEGPIDPQIGPLPVTRQSKELIVDANGSRGVPHEPDAAGAMPSGPSPAAFAKQQPSGATIPSDPAAPAGEALPFGAGRGYAGQADKHLKENEAADDGEVWVVYVEAPGKRANADARDPIAAALARRGIELQQADAKKDAESARARREFRRLEQEERALQTQDGARGGRSGDPAKPGDRDSELRKAVEPRRAEFVMVEIDADGAQALLGDLQQHGLVIHQPNANMLAARQQEKGKEFAQFEATGRATPPGEGKAQGGGFGGKPEEQSTTPVPGTPLVRGDVPEGAPKKFGFDRQDAADETKRATAGKAWRWSDDLADGDRFAGRFAAREPQHPELGAGPKAEIPAPAPPKAPVVAGAPANRGEENAGSPAGPGGLALRPAAQANAAAPAEKPAAADPLPAPGLTLPAAPPVPLPPPPAPSAEPPPPALAAEPLPPSPAAPAPLAAPAAALPGPDFAEAPPIDLGPPLANSLAGPAPALEKKAEISAKAAGPARKVRILFVLPTQTR